MNLQEHLDFINYVSRKEVSGEAFTPDEYNTALPVVNIRLFYSNLGQQEGFFKAQPTNESIFEVNQRMTEDMRPFKVVMGDDTTPLTVTNGIANLPPDYYYITSMLFRMATNTNSGLVIKDRVVNVVTDKGWAALNASVLGQPSQMYPIANFQANHIRVRPKTVSRLMITYLRLPKTPVYAYTIDPVTDAVIYNAAGSTELEWDEPNQIKLAYMLLELAGISISHDRLVQYAMAKNQAAK